MGFLDIEIRSNASPYNMAAWHYEKCLSILESIACICDLQSTNNAQDKVRSNLYAAAYDATKLLSFSCGSYWNTSDPDLIVEKGRNGLEELLVKYGVLKETTEDERHRKSNEILIDILIALNSDTASTARTSIHELLAKIPSSDHEWEPIKDLTESLTMGEMTWTAYKSTAKILLLAMQKGS
jgi:hypothetical protein